MLLLFDQGATMSLDGALRRLAEMQYERTSLDLHPGSFRVRTLEVLPAYDERAARIEFFGDEIERLALRSARGEILEGRRDRPLPAEPS